MAKRVYKKRQINIPEPKGEVLSAIQGGARTQDEIKLAINKHITIDQLCDALADLHAENKLDRYALRRRVYIAA